MWSFCLPPRCWDHRCMPSSLAFCKKIIWWQFVKHSVNGIWAYSDFDFCSYFPGIYITRLFLWLVMASPKLLSEVLESHQSRRTVQVLPVWGLCHWACLPQPAWATFCSTAVLLVLNCNIGYRALTLPGVGHGANLIKKEVQATGWDLASACFSSVTVFLWMGEMLHSFQLYQGFCLVVIECSLLSVCYLTVTWWYVSFIYLSAYLFMVFQGRIFCIVLTAWS